MGVQGLWQTRSWFNSTFEWNAKSGSSVAVPEVVALDTETYMAPGFLDSNALSPGLMMMNLFRFQPVQVSWSNRHTWNDFIVARYHNTYSMPIHIHQLQKSWMLFDICIYIKKNYSQSNPVIIPGYGANNLPLKSLNKLTS